jgi:hypothetical protein
LAVGDTSLGRRSANGAGAVVDESVDRPESDDTGGSTGEDTGWRRPPITPRADSSDGRATARPTDGTEKPDTEAAPTTRPWY